MGDWGGLKSLRLMAAALTGAALLMTGLTLPFATTSTAATPPRSWVSHSAYGLQLSVPKSWGVAYFEDCPKAKVGTLLIGTQPFITNCANYSARTNIVTMHPETSEAVIGPRERRFRIHGLPIVSYSVGGEVSWYVSSESIVVTAQGPGSLGVIHTLTPTTRRAEAAPGLLNGAEYLEALVQAPITGPVSVARLQARGATQSVVQAYDARFSGLFSPGVYRITGHSGNVECPPVIAIVRSGRTSQAPTIYCQGD
jgi:hypothetical protein